MSAALEVTVLSPALAGLERSVRLVAAGMAETEPLLEALGAELVSQAQRRIADEKEAPDGSGWAPWSEGYAPTRHAGQSLLEADGGLLGSLQSAVSPARVEAGSNLAYAALQQFGGTAGMPPGPAAVKARAYLGLSAGNEAELLAIVIQFADAHLRRHLR